MPFYRLDGRMVHMRGTGLPKPCHANAFCNPELLCAAPSAFLYDWWPAPNRRTCDLPLCAAHAREVGANRHYCPRHHLASPEARQLGLFTSLVFTS